MYPNGTSFNIKFELGFLDTVMEGKHRPGHFKGVAQVVKRLLEIVTQHVFYLGQKDFQQYKVIEKMIRDLKIPVELKMVSTLREPDGLAMSSRNRRLSEEARINAPRIYSILQNAKVDLNKKSVTEVKNEAIHALELIPKAKPEYFEIADAQTLELIQTFEKNQRIVICTAVWIDDVRLIDCILN
jgi:pantoate--beta-alanine ligase